MVRISGRIVGKVQGVGFRVFVQRAAQAHGIEGEVWNTRDGAVEFDAGAVDSASLEAFVLELKDGPGTVRKIDVCPMIGEAPHPGFRIGYTR